jgi:hypothetical protein
MPTDQQLQDGEAPRHRAEAVTWDSEPEARRRLMNSEFCALCRKLALKSEADARSYIGLLINVPIQRRRVRAAGFTLHPHECRHGKGWHVGRDAKTAELVKERTGR